MNIVIMLANIVTAFAEKTVGTKVTKPKEFMELLTAAVEATNFDEQQTKGQALIKLDGAVTMVSCGEGLRTQDPADYINVLHRGVVEQFLKRARACECTGVSAVVYTPLAYATDPEVTKEEIERVTAAGATHILVAVLAHGGPRSQRSPARLVAGMAGENHDFDYLKGMGSNIQDKGEHRRKIDVGWYKKVTDTPELCRRVIEHYRQYCTVAD